ncbi:MAG: HAD-IC family P-type ATPase [Clostridiales bacterium]|jgi:Cd2+/Zn2+-exporting ATPase|nr:HAD-IC family P-type ATPase [Clostridiales bacterium]
MKKRIIRISIGAAVFLGALIAGAENFPKPAGLTVYLAAILIIGGDVLLRALKNILKGKVFDENFLMTIAAVGAFCIGEYPEAAAVMLFYQVGETFQYLAVARSRKSIAALMDIRPDYANVIRVSAVPEKNDASKEEFETGNGKKTEVITDVMNARSGKNDLNISGSAAGQNLSAVDESKDYAEAKNSGISGSAIGQNLYAADDLKSRSATVRVDPSEVKTGEIIVVAPGEKIPVDAVVIEGFSSVDTAALTGESKPRDVAPGDGILSGCVNLSGVIKARAVKEFGESTASKILDLVENAGARKSNSENFITKFARYYTPAVVAFALLLAVVPPAFSGFQNFSEWLYNALTFLVVSCPCALVISIPMSFFGGIGGASKKGVLIKGGNYLEALANTETVVFDKTGTLTKGVLKVDKIIAPRMQSGELLALAAYAESYSSHPVSAALRKAHGKDIDKSLITDAEEIAGHGVFAVAGDKRVHVGNARLMKKIGAEIEPFIISDPQGTDAHTAPPRAREYAEKIYNLPSGSAYGDKTPGSLKNSAYDNKIPDLRETDAGGDKTADLPGTAAYVAVDGKYEGVIFLSDEIKEDSARAIAEIRAAGVKKIVMLTGDGEAEAKKVADALKIDEYYAGLLPSDKVQKAEELMGENAKNSAKKARKAKLVFVGDGINDAPVLARADIGIAMGGLGSDAAVEAADVVVMTDEPSKIAAAIRTAKKTTAIARQNSVFAIGVKLLVLALGAVGIAKMWGAVFADVGVAILAILNAFRALK